MSTDYLLQARAFHRPGVLARMTGMFYRRALNIRTLSVGEEDEEGLVPIVVRVTGPAAEIERLTLSIQNLIDVTHAEFAPFPLTAPADGGYELKP
ncbi:MAG: ACT domain-containing protein [Candidatus Binatia bacterium]|nr:ACT domain-containing protein [Candidatus Binatia bacterium]